jgi:hypothetical protein
VPEIGASTQIRISRRRAERLSRLYVRRFAQLFRFELAIATRPAKWRVRTIIAAALGKLSPLRSLRDKTDQLSACRQRSLSIALSAAPTSGFLLVS